MTSRLRKLQELLNSTFRFWITKGSIGVIKGDARSLYYSSYRGFMLRACKELGWRRPNAISRQGLKLKEIRKNSLLGG